MSIVTLRGTKTKTIDKLKLFEEYVCLSEKKTNINMKNMTVQHGDICFCLGRYDMF